MPQPILAGIPAGGLKETFAVKVLLCCLLEAAGGALSWERLCEACCGEGLVDYFTLSTAMRELEQNGNIRALAAEDGAAYRLTALGEETVKKLGDTLPVSLREYLKEKGETLSTGVHRPKAIQAAVEPDGSGFQVRCSLHEGNLAFFSMSLYAPDRQQAQLIARNFEKRAAELYGHLVGMLTGDESV